MIILLAQYVALTCLAEKAAFDGSWCFVLQPPVVVIVENRCRFISI